MNRTVVSILLIAAVVSVQGDNCCQYPDFLSVNTVNVTGSAFRCKEPLSYYCSRPTPRGNVLMPTVGIAGVTKYPNEFEVIVQNDGYVPATLICNASTSKNWHVEGHPNSEFSSFGCVRKGSNGKWIPTWLY